VDTGSLPEVDLKMQYPEGFNIFSRTPVLFYYLSAVYSLVCAKFGLGLYPSLLLLPPLIYCVTVFTVYSVSRGLFGSELGALFSAALYGFSMASVSRSTIAHLLYENMALPLLFLHVLFLFKALDAVASKGMLFYASLSGLFLFTALSSWFVSGFYFAVLVACGSLLYFTSMRWDLRFYSVFGILTLSVFAAHNVFPFLSKQPIYLYLAFALSASVVISNRARFGTLKAVLAYALILAFFMIGARPDPDFSHVYSVFEAKVLHLNKWYPNMPYEVRMTWVSGYLSPSLDNITLFSIILPFGLISLAAIISSWFRIYLKPQVKLAALLAIAFALLFLMAVRLSVFTIFFLSTLCAYAVALAEKKFPSILGHIRVILIGIVLVEFGLGYYLTTSANYTLHPDVAGMLDYVRANTSDDAVVLSSYFESPMVEVYAGRKILLNPFWENAQLRRKVGFFDRLLFEGESDYWSTLWKYDVQLVAYNRGLCEGAPPFVGEKPQDGSFIKSLCSEDADSSLFFVDYGNPSYFLIKPIP
jgi:hypothetical protein